MGFVCLFCVADCVSFEYTSRLDLQLRDRQLGRRIDQRHWRHQRPSGKAFKLSIDAAEPEAKLAISLGSAV